MISPIIAAPVAQTNTAPAAMSFICPAKGCLPGETKSTKRSIEELNNSAAITIAMHSMTMIRSEERRVGKEC